MNNLKLMTSDLTNELLGRIYAARRPVIFISAPGGAKTSIIKQWAKYMDLKLDDGFGIVTEHLAQYDSPDIRGYNMPTKDGAGRLVSQFTVSNIVRAIEATGKKYGVLFLDEVFQSDHGVQKAVAPLFDSRIIGEHGIPDGWIVIGASNRLSDKAGANRPLSHLVNRTCIVELTPSVEGHMKWGMEEHKHPLMMAFAKQNPGVVFQADPPKAPDQPFCTARSLEYAFDFLTQGGSSMNLPTDPVTTTMVAGWIGQGAATALFSFLKVVDVLPTIEDILRDPMKAMVPPVERLDARYTAMQMVVYHAKPENIDCMFTYLERLPKDIQTIGATALIKRSGGEFIDSPKMTAWITANQDLIVATMAE